MKGHLAIKDAVINYENPLSEIESRFNKIPRDKEVVFYCEVTWIEAVARFFAGRILIKNGYKQENIKVFGDGYGAWKNTGYPIGKL